MSRDGRRLAFVRQDETLEGYDIWVRDLSAAKVPRRLTPRIADGRPVRNDRPLWTPDGRHVVFVRLQKAKVKLIRASIDGSGEEVELWSGPTWLYPMLFDPKDWTMAVFGPTARTNFDIFLMHRKGSDRNPAWSAPELFLGRLRAEAFGQISPDGHWMLYASEESGNYEIYVTSYPKPGAVYPISKNGGREPRWNPRGGEIVYLNGTKMYTVDVTLSPEFRAAEPQLLFDGPFPDVPGLGFDITADGKQFLMLENRDFLKPTTTLTVVTGFFDELRNRVPSGKTGK